MIMGAYLDKPVTDKYCDAGHANGIRFGLCSVQGWRVSMEDAHVALLTLKPPFEKWSFFGVFDGHEGDIVSKFCAQHLIDAVFKTEEFYQLQDQHLPDEKKGKLVERGIVQGFLNFDAEMRKLPEPEGGPMRSGTTAICALFTPDTIYLANCGDSRGILVSKKNIAVATLDHKPINPKERERIQNAGGSIFMHRVNGSLAVSRALGDFEYKNVPNKGACEQLVSPEPDISAWKRTADDEFVVLACDGLWDVMTNEEMYQFVHHELKNTDKLETVCERVVDNCLNRGSRDNISVILISLGASHCADTTDGCKDSSKLVEVNGLTGNVHEDGQSSLY